MYLLNNFEDHVIRSQYNQGYRKLKVLSGYVSPLYVEHIIQTYKELELEVIVGMTSKDGLAVWNHLMFVEIANKYSERLKIHYHIQGIGNHRKVYLWEQEGLILQEKIFIGSANFSYYGFEKQSEVLVESNAPNVDELFDNLNLIECRREEVATSINLFDETSYQTPVVNILISDDIVGSEQNRITAKFVNEQGLVPSKSGLNWGQRPGRNPNQAYIPIKKSVHDTNPYFFPEAAKPFLIYTDDHRVLRCVMAQDFRKAIQTTENNSLLGAYFRERLGVPDGAPVTINHLNNYGRDDVTISKIDEETYYLDFSV